MMSDQIEAALARHERIALQLSGGRDSIACLYLLLPYIDRFTVYWCNTGSAYPETSEFMEFVQGLVPRFVEIDGRQPDVVATFGLPSDIVPASRTPLGLIVSGKKAVMIQDRYSCCARSMMAPTHERMVADGITLVIRGQKNADTFKAPVQSGIVEDGIEYIFPIEDWSAEHVMAYLKEVEAPIPRFYETMDSAPDCMTCSAWWENGAAAYLKAHHEPEYREVQRRLDLINEAVGESIANFNQEVSA